GHARPPPFPSPPSNVTFAPDKDEASTNLRALFRADTGRPSGDIRDSFERFIRADEGFHRWLGRVSDSSGVRVDEKQIFRTVKYKYKNYFGESRRLIVTKLRYSHYSKRLCGAWFSQQILQKAYYYTSRQYFAVDRERDFDLDHFDEDECRSQDRIEFTAVFTLSTLGDPERVWRKDLLERELLEGLRFVFPDMEVAVLQTSINPADAKFDKMRRKVQHQVSLTVLPGVTGGSARPKSTAWVSQFAKAGLRLWLSTGFLQAREDDRVFSIEGAISVSDIVSDATGLAFKANYVLRSSREATWSNERLARLFRSGFLSRDYRLDAMQIRLNRVPERAVFVVKSAAGCSETGANASLIHHRDALLLSKEDLRHWSQKNASQLREDAASLIADCYANATEEAKLVARGFRLTLPDSVEGATFLNLDAQIVGSQLQFRTQYTIQSADPLRFEPSPANALAQFRAGLLRRADQLRVQGPVPHRACDDCLLEAACEPRLDELHRREFAVRRLVHLVRARVSPRIWSAAGDSVSLRQLISHWVKVLYLDYFRDSLRENNQPPIYTYVPFDSDMPIEIEEERQQITLSYVLMRDSELIDTGFRNRLLWQEEDFARNFLSAFREFNEITGLFSVVPEPLTDVELYPLLPRPSPVMVVSPLDKEVILTFSGLSQEKCTDAILRQKLSSLDSSRYRIGRKVATVPDGGNCVVRFHIGARNPAEVDTNTWNTTLLKQYFATNFTGEFSRISLDLVDTKTPCVYCDATRRIFINIEAEYSSAVHFAGVELLTVNNYAEKRRHLLDDHLVPAFDPARRSNQFLGRRHYQLGSPANADFDYRRVGERERYSVVFDARMVPEDASWSEYHLRKLLLGWVSSQNAKAGSDMHMNNITVQILDPVEMSEFIPPPRAEVYTAMVNMSMPAFINGDIDVKRVISDAFYDKARTFTLNFDREGIVQVVNREREDGSQSTYINIENCPATMLVQLPQLLTRNSVIRKLQTGLSRFSSSSLDRLAGSIDVDFTKMDINVFYNSEALPKADCGQTSRRVKFLLMLRLLNTNGNRAIANVTTGSAEFTYRNDMVAGIKKLVEHNVLDYYGLDISITGNKEVEIMYRSTPTTGVVQVDYNLLSVIPGFKWITFVRDTNDILNRISLRTSYDGHQYHDVMKRIGYVQFRGVPTTHVYDRCSFSRHFRVLQNTQLFVLDRDQFQLLGYFLNPTAAVQEMVRTIFILKLSGIQIYSIVPNTTVLHRHQMTGDSELSFSISYELIASHRFNIGENILRIFIDQMLDRMAQVYGFIRRRSTISMLNVKQNGIHCISNIVTESDTITTKRVGCFPVLDASLTVGVCAKSNPHIARQVPIRHNFVLQVEADFVFSDIFPQNDPEARAVIEYMLALTFDDRITPGIQLTWDPTFSGQTAMNVSRSSSKLQLAVETYYILLKSKALAGNVTATMVEAIFSANVNKVLSYFGTGSILRSAINIWNPDCSKLGASNPGAEIDNPIGPALPAPSTPPPRGDYLGKTGVVGLRLFVSTYKNFEIASLTMELRPFTFSKWLRQVFEALRDYRLLNPVHSNLLTEIDNNDPTVTRLIFDNLRVDLGLRPTSPQALANAIADLAVSSASRHFVVSSSIFSNLRVSAELIPTSSAAAAGRSSRRRRSADKASPPGSTCGFSHQVRLTLVLRPRYHQWFSHQDRIKPVLSYLITRSLLEAVNSAGLNVSLNESQIELAYISVTTHAVEFLADLALLPCPSTAAPAAASMADDAALQQRFYSSWLRNSVAGACCNSDWQASTGSGSGSVAAGSCACTNPCCWITGPGVTASPTGN
uniref:PDDEXK_1 domain-containing protein n=1 Tax=Macrostomum lignano TaxID=282301 RepID=A0A1I8IT96_9PLAT